jgi:hypothetical protein
MSNAQGRVDVVKMTCVMSGYRVGDAVGKATDQVGLTDQGDFVRGDAEVYDKWSQAIASSADLVGRATATPPGRGADVSFGRVIPVLAVPDGTLWECRYDQGALIREPEQVEHVEFFIGKDWLLRGGPLSFSVSHLEVLTYSGLKRWLRDERTFDVNSHFGQQCYQWSRSW